MQQEAFLPIGTIIRDHYVVEDLLGKGEGDLVYLVRDRWATRNLFVLKERINPDKQARDRFLFEGVVLKQLHHPALQRVYRVFEENAGYRVYMLMQYIAGQDLETMHRQWPNRSFPLPLTLSLMAPVVEAVTYLHSQSNPVIHRDINPSNIIVPRDKRTVLVNFGIDRGYNPTETVSTTFLSSSGYGAPEQYKGETNPSIDLYALAATFYTLLTGIVPPDARERAAQLVNRGIDPLMRADEVTSAVPVTIGEVIHSAMSLSSDERFSSVAEFWRALRGLPSSHSIASIVPVTSNENTEEMQEAPPQSPVGPDLSRPSPIYRPPDEDTEESKEQSHDEALESPIERTPSETSNETPSEKINGIPATAERSDSESVGTRFIAPPEPVKVPTGTGRIKSGLYGFLSSLSYFIHLHNPVSTQHSRKLVALLLLLLVLAILLSIGTILWSRAIGFHHPGVANSTPVVVHKATPTPTATSKAGAVYTGTIHDILANTSATIFLTGMQLHTGNINGYLLIDNGARGSGPFQGTFNTTQHIQFVVTDSTGHPIFSFEGGVHPDGNIAGSYCALNQNGQCSGDYGLWSASPTSLILTSSMILPPPVFRRAGAWLSLYPSQLQNS